MIDCMSYCNASFVDDDKLYEMLEDDMRTIANLSNNNNSASTSNSSSSPSCLSDEEQLAALSNDTTNLIDEFLLFNNSSSSGNSTSSHISPNSNTNQQQQPINSNSSNSSAASSNGILSHHTPTNGLSSNSNSPSSTTSSSSSNSSSSSYYQSPPVLSYHHQHSGDIFNYSTSSSSSSSSSSPSSSSTSSPSISAVPSPLSLSSSSSSLCAALANASFSSGSSSSSSSACSSNLASPVCLSPGQQVAHFHSSSQQLSLPPQHPHQYHHAAQISPSSHLHHPQQQQQQHIIHHSYQNYQQVQQQQPQQEQFMLSESTINYHLNKQKQHLMLEDDFGTTNVVGGGNNVNQYMVQAQETSYNPSATNTAASTRPSNISPSPNNTMTGNAAYSLFQTINPMDINRNYAATTSESQFNNTTTKASRPMCLPTSGNSNNKTAYLNTTSGQQTIKRGKFSHNQQSGVFRIKQESSSSIQSDGESSSVSNESDSNSSTFSNDHNIQHFSSQSKKLIITATKLETQSFYSSSSASSSPSSTSSSSQQQPQFTPTQTSLPSINVIKIAAANQKEHADNLLLPITPAKISIVEPSSASSNTKTIIQYKQIVNPSVNTTTAKQSIKHSKQNGNTTTAATTAATTTPSSNNAAVTAAVSPVQVTLRSDGKAYPKPPYSYSCLIAMALRNSDSGTLPVSDIYEFIVENFPYYKTARDGWKNSIRHNLSLNKCFEKIENPTNGSKKGCLWALNPDKCKKLEEECKRCRQRDPVNIRLSMSRPDDLNKIERGEQRIKKYTAQRKQQQQQMSLDTSNTQSDAASNGSSSPSTFLLEWSSKSNPANQSQSLVKDEPSDQFENFDDLGNSDIKFDPILLSTVNSTI